MQKNPHANAKLAILIDKSNFDAYAPALPAQWQAIHLGGGEYDEARLIDTGAEAILSDPMLPIGARVIESMPLKIIHSFGVGYHFIDTEAARARGIYVCNNARVNSGAVAEQAVLLMLAVLRGYHEAEAAVYAAKQGDYKLRCLRAGLRELGGCRVGILGLGAIGKELALRLKPFGCELWYYDAFPVPEAQRCGAQEHTLEEVLAGCDIVSLHMPVFPSTVNMINQSTLALMKPNAILINTARGELVDQDAVCAALISGRLGGFGADTLTPEPVRADNPIINLPEETRRRVALSPHIGGITAETFVRSYKNAFDNIARALGGERPLNIVNGL